MPRIVLVALLLAMPLGAAPSGTRITLLDLRPSFLKPGNQTLLRNGTRRKPGLFIAEKRYRGLNAPLPSRVGFDLELSFTRFSVKVGLLDGSHKSAQAVFRVLGDGKVLAATPPLFPGQAPVELLADVSNVFLLELVCKKIGRGHANVAWIGGELIARPDADLSRFRPFDAPFSPRAYPSKFRRRVNDAIDAGVRAMQRAQRASGEWPRRGDSLGMTALCTLAILKGGVKATDPSMVRAFGYMKRQPFTRVYDVSVLIMAIEARYFPGGADEKDAYKSRPRLAKKIISEEDRAWIRRAARWLVDQQGMGFRDAAMRSLNPVWRYPSGGYDLSNTQYALLGLSAARRCAVPNSKVWLKVLRFLIGAQEKDGPRVQVSRYERRKNFIYRRYENARARGFTYTLTTQPATGSMTSAGVCALILCQQALYRNTKYQQSYKGKTRAAIRDGLAWIEEYYTVEENPFKSSWWTYYLFNLERAGVLLDTRFIGTRDWYHEGAEALLARRNKNGTFQGPGGQPMIDTAFAVLFLKRATVPARTSPLD